jgi:hypothetical protein
VRLDQESDWCQALTLLAYWAKPRRQLDLNVRELGRLFVHLDALERRARRLLNGPWHWATVETIAYRLLEEREITGAEARRLFRDTLRRFGRYGRRWQRVAASVSSGRV